MKSENEKLPTLYLEAAWLPEGSDYAILDSMAKMISFGMP